MKMNLEAASAMVLFAGTLFATPASAQWSSAVQVSGAVEPLGSLGQNRGGVSTARCGNNVVVGFGDSESGNSNSFAGYAVSSDGGRTFTDKGVLPNSPVNDLGDGFGPTPDGTTVDHDLSVACANSRTFYYAATLVESDAPQVCTAEGICSSISVSISNDGGQSWGLPVVVARRNIDNNQLYSPSVAVDPATPKRLYVAYLDTNGSPVDSDFVFPDCGGNFITEVKVAGSSDGGKTWTMPLTVDHVCNLSSDPEVQGAGFGPPNVLVSPGGKVYLAYEFQAYIGLPSEIRFTRSVNQAATFSTPIVVSNDAVFKAFPQLAVDRTSTSFRGAIYLTWSGMPRGTSTEVLMSDSLNQGVSFSFPRSVRATSMGTQVNPVVAVDNDGQVASCYYVTGTNTSTSSSNYFYNCLTSINHAATWTTYQKLATSAPPGLDALTSDFLLLNDGFFTAYETQSSTQRQVVGRKADNP
jgi:hypothetical protein